MEIGEGIEVVEGEGFARVVMPALPARLGFVKGKRVEAWMAIVLAVGGPLALIALAVPDDVRLSRFLHPRDFVDVAVSVVGIAFFLALEIVLVLGALGIRKQFSPTRAKVVIDQHGVRSPMWGPLDLFRIRLKLMRAVVVARPRRKGRRGRSGDEEGATVRFEAGRQSRSIGGGYSHEQARRLAFVFSQQIERVAGVVVAVRDEFDGGETIQDSESILGGGGVDVEMVAEGMRLSLGNFWSVMDRSGDPIEYAMSPMWGVVCVPVGVGTLGLGAILPNRFQGAVEIYFFALMVMMGAWMVMMLSTRIRVYSEQRRHRERDGVVGATEVASAVGEGRDRRDFC